MKKTILLLIILCIFNITQSNAQISNMLKKAKDSMSDELNLNKKSDKKADPSCACADAEMILGMQGNLNLDYSEVSITVNEEGGVLAYDRNADNYYIVNNGKTEGPYLSGDPKIANYGDTFDPENMLVRYKNHISMKGEKYLITFGGKEYGPYATISDFCVSKSKDKFAAVVVKNMATSQSEADKYQKAIENAKTDQEKMNIAMEYSQKVQQNILSGGGATSLQPEIVSNVPGVNPNSYSLLQAGLRNSIKYDDILLYSYNKITDLTGKVILIPKSEFQDIENIFINSSNTKQAYYTYGTITFSDNTKISDVSNPHLMKKDGKVYLAYYYYSPVSNAVMRCKIPF